MEVSCEILKWDELNTQDKELIAQALEVRKKAYAKYSSFMVGCVIIDTTGTSHIGRNVERASYSETTLWHQSLTKPGD
ncbi:MAG: hypothetical protein ABIH87_02860 [bacterium]